MKRTATLNESELNGLIKECTVEFFNETAKKLFESSWSRVMQWIDNHDIATISAFRGELKDVHDFSKTDIPEGMQIGSAFSTKMNRERSKELQRYLMGLGYGVTKLSEGYMEGMGGQDLNEVVEESWFVVNLNNKPNFYNDLFKLSEKFNQDSFFYKPVGGQALRVGTNDADFPGYGNVAPQDEITSLSNKFMARIKNACFAFVKDNYDDDCPLRNDNEPSPQQMELARIKQEAEKKWDEFNNYNEEMYIKLRTKQKNSRLDETEKEIYEKLVYYKTLRARFPDKKGYVDFATNLHYVLNREAPTLLDEILWEYSNDWHRLVNESGVTLSTTDDIKGFARQSIAKYSKI